MEKFYCIIKAPFSLRYDDENKEAAIGAINFYKKNFKTKDKSRYMKITDSDSRLDLSGDELDS
jgi:hypothetical protein